MKNKDLMKIGDKELGKIIDLTGIDATYDCNIDDSEDVTNIVVTFEGEELGYMIGNHGKHLDSLQYILQLLIRRAINDEEFAFRLTIDVAGYRKEKDEKLEKFALQKADDARILGEYIDLEPMKPYERRVIHMTLQKFDDVSTESHGEGNDRYVRIVPSSEADLGILKDSSEEEEESEE